MNIVFYRWFEKNHDLFSRNEIVTENIRHSPEGSPVPCVTLEQESAFSLGQISVWETGGMDVEVVNTQSEKVILFEHHELQVNSDFEAILGRYFEAMRTGYLS